MKKADILIVGQGLAGSILAYELMEMGQKVAIVDPGLELTSSRVAAGLYNPITGRKMTKTWLADRIFPQLQDYYTQLEGFLSAKFHFPMKMYRPFQSVEEENDWMGKASQPDFSKYIDQVYSRSMQKGGINDPFGGIILRHTGYVDLPNLISSFSNYFKSKGVSTQKLFEFSTMQKDGESLHYGEFEAKKVIFCDGPFYKDNPYWKNLRFRLVKGEVIDVDFQLGADLIVNRGVFIIPKKGFSTVGSTYDHNDLSWEPTEKGSSSICEKLDKIFSGKYRILRQRAGIRPATFDRRPFIGFNSEDNRMGIFNGFGSKGVSLVPFFAKQFAKNIVFGEEVLPEVGVER